MLRLILLFLICCLAVSAGRAEEETVEGAPPAAKTKKERPAKAKPGPNAPFRVYAPFWRSSGAAQPWSADGLKAQAGVAEAKVLGGRFEESPLLLFVAIDFSDNLILTESAKESLAATVRALRPEVYTGLLRIPEQPMVIADPGTNREQFVDALKTLPMSGRAGFFEMVDVIAGVTDPLVRGNPVRAAVLYLTDSEISRYRNDYTNPVINTADSRDLSRRFPDALIREKVNTLTNTLLRSSVPIFVVHLRYRSDALNEAYQTGLRRLAETTGGRAVFCRSIAEIPVAIGDMVNAIQAMGLLEVEVPGTVTGAFTLSLEGSEGPLQHRTLFQQPR